MTEITCPWHGRVKLMKENDTTSDEVVGGDRPNRRQSAGASFLCIGAGAWATKTASPKRWASGLAICGEVGV
jgi:hypothetical protein